MGHQPLLTFRKDRAPASIWLSVTAALLGLSPPFWLMEQLLVTWTCTGGLGVGPLLPEYAGLDIPAPSSSLRVLDLNLVLHSYPPLAWPSLKAV